MIVVQIYQVRLDEKLCVLNTIIENKTKIATTCN